MTTPPLRIVQKDGSFLELGDSFGTGELQVHVDDTVESVAVQLNREQAIQVILHLAKVFELSLAAVGELEADQ